MNRPQLFLFHFAGGNRYSFEFLTPWLGDFEVVTMELPGRGRRMNEILIKDFDLAARDIYEQLNQKITGNDIILYGHSLGAYLAFKMAAMLEKDGKKPACLLVSGNPGPGARELKNRHLMEHNDFMDELRLLGGTPEEFINDKELFSFFEPILRADFELAEKNGLELAEPVNIPLFAMMGEQEEGTEKIANWGRFTTSGFDYELMKGDHFFIYNHPQRLANIIHYCYDKSI